ncbi:hypothetical protein [Pseudomonas multiresinivorans]|uniref:Uncharacterized protein n=1 Tax=Pseudomonas multiresinivorans TaxID=95301 RepID=A0A7Z3BPY6_9PSED|nr:hypothetical protein [Pseudomonas multiresinivorans]QJP08364.1 hypothetical protein G4G71_10935 [Pseudomonas multiresinivorans]QJP10492.1 hypothetical protein G4G71_22345 [Pseudomonas multiresinivorans]
MKLKTIDPSWVWALALMILFFKALDVANGWTAESPAYPITHASTGRR